MGEVRFGGGSQVVRVGSGWAGGGQGGRGLVSPD